MSQLKWSDSMSIGVPKFDSHHRRMMDLVNEYVTALESNQGNDALAPMLMALYEYTKMHFNSEEAYLTEIGYPEAASHKKEHDDLAKQVLAYHEKIKHNQNVDSVAVMNYLKEWLIKHIEESDRLYSKYYSEMASS